MPGRIERNTRNVSVASATGRGAGVVDFRFRRRWRVRALALAAAVLILPSAVLKPTAALAQSLRGSAASLDLQNGMARRHDFTYLRTSSQLNRFVSARLLVRLRSNGVYQLHDVSFPYARPEVKTFVERLARQYRNACGEALVVTSLTRPLSRQPRNASDRSVHPTGMAVDFRRSNSPACRRWIERVLVSLEGKGVLEATRERRPPHYHVALFPDPYSRYVTRMSTARSVTASRTLRYRVQRGDSLWEIARNHGVSIDELKTRNGLRGSRIYPGQLLAVPASR